MLITFSGLDGSGKSTQAQMLQKVLQELGFRTVFFHLTHWTWVNRIGEKYFKKANDKKIPSKKHPGVLLPRLTIMLLDVLRFWLLWIYAKWRGQILICDRYFYDLGVQAVYKHGMSMSMANIYWHLVPRPSAAFWLKVLPVVAQQREGDHGADYYKEKELLYSEAFKCFHAIHIETVSSIEETFKLILNYVQQHMGIDPKC